MTVKVTTWSLGVKQQLQLSLQNFRRINVTKLGDELQSTRLVDIMAYSASVKTRKEIENFDEQENKEK